MFKWIGSILTLTLLNSCSTFALGKETLQSENASPFFYSQMAEILDFFLLSLAGFFFFRFLFKRRSFLKILLIGLPAMVGIALLDQFLGYPLNTIWNSPELFFTKLCFGAGSLVGLFAGLARRPAEKARADSKKKEKKTKKENTKKEAEERKKWERFPSLNIKEKLKILDQQDSIDKIVELLKEEKKETLLLFIKEGKKGKIRNKLIRAHQQLKHFNAPLLLEISKTHSDQQTALTAFKQYLKNFNHESLLKEQFNAGLIKKIVQNQAISSTKEEISFLMNQSPQKEVLTILKKRCKKEKLKTLLKHWDKETWYFELFKNEDLESLPLEERLEMLKGEIRRDFRDKILSSLPEENLLSLYKEEPELFKNYDLNTVPALTLSGMENLSDKEILQKLELRGDVDAGNSEGVTALYAASFRGSLSLVKTLLKKGADVNRTGDTGVYPLFAACQQGHKEIIETLLTAGADVNNIALAGSPLTVMASEQGKADLARMLLDKGAEIDHRDELGCSALYYASQNGNIELVEYLISCKAEVNHCNRQGGTPLFIASQQGYEEIVKMLLDAGADKNWALPDGQKPIEIAYNRGHSEIVELLGGEEALKAKTPAPKKKEPLFGTHKDKAMVQSYLKNLAARAKKEKVYSIWSWVDSRDSSTCYQFIANVSDSNDFEFDSPAHVTEKTMLYEAGTMRTAGRELAGDEEKTETTPELSTALFKAVEQSNLASAKKLLDQGADPQSKGDRFGHTTAMQEAASQNNYDMVNLFLEHGADVNYQDTEGFPLISLIAHNPNDGTSEMIRYLVNNNADLYATTARGRTALQIIRRHMPDFDMVALACPHCSGKISSRDPKLLLNIRMLFRGGMISGGTIPCAACGNRTGLQDWHQATLQRFGTAYQNSFSEE